MGAGLRIIGGKVSLAGFRVSGRGEVRCESLLGVTSKAVIVKRIKQFSFMGGRRFLVRILSLIGRQGVSMGLVLVNANRALRRVESLMGMESLRGRILFINTVPGMCSCVRTVSVFTFPSH